MNAPTILHVTSLFGGGVERHVRDIVRAVPRGHLLWHAGDGVDVIEEPAARRFHVLAPDVPEARGAPLARWLAGRGVGLVHLHQLTRAPRARAAWASEALGVPGLVTLHDVLFLRPDAFAAPDPLAPDAAWLRETSAVLRRARAVLAPSPWLAALARDHVPGLAVEVVPNGSAPRVPVAPIAPRRAFAEHRPGTVVALLGALGAHKGAGLVEEVAHRLEGTDIALVVVGYLEQQFHPGWRVPGRLFVHGAFAEGDAPGLLAGYGARLVVLPNTVPESFSYALSDAWAAGVPALVAPAGALGERVATHGGGWCLPSGFDAAAVADAIRELAGGPREAERARVQSRLARPDPGRVPDLDTMARTLDAFYARFGIDPASPGPADDAAMAALVATNVDGSLFRAELVRLADELAQSLAALDDARRRGDAFEAEARGWIAKLEGDVRAVQEELRGATAERDRLATEADALRLDREALERLPAAVRRLLRKLAFDARR